MEVRERLERLPLLGQVARQAGRRKDTVGGKRGAAVGVAVADVDDMPGRKQ